MIKKILPWFVFILLSILIIVGFATKDKLTQFLSTSIKKNASPELILTGNNVVDSLYNYSKNGLNHKITFLEFGAKSCRSCKMMEDVMSEIRLKHPTNVNVVFLNISNKENILFMKLYGVLMIPTQVLLNREGQEIFRHTGYLSTEDLNKKIENYLN